MGKSSIHGPLSIVMSNYQRVPCWFIPIFVHMFVLKKTMVFNEIFPNNLGHGQLGLIENSQRLYLLQISTVQMDPYAYLPKDTIWSHQIPWKTHEIPLSILQNPMKSNEIQKIPWNPIRSHCISHELDPPSKWLSTLEGLEGTGSGTNGSGNSW